MNDSQNTHNPHPLQSAGQDDFSLGDYLNLFSYDGPVRAGILGNSLVTVAA